MVLPAVGHLGQGREPCLGPGPGSRSPRGPLRSGAHGGPTALWPGLPEATLLWRLPPSLPPGPRLLKAPAQGWSELGQIPLPLLPNVPRTGPWLRKPAPSGARDFLPYSPALHLPTDPRCPGTPPAELSLPHSPCLPHCPEDPTSLIGRSSPCQPFPQQAAGRYPQTTWHSLQWRPSCPAPRLYLGNLWAVFQRSVSPECISESLVLPHRNAELLLVDRQE